MNLVCASERAFCIVMIRIYNRNIKRAFARRQNIGYIPEIVIRVLVRAYDLVDIHGVNIISAYISVFIRINKYAVRIRFYNKARMTEPCYFYAFQNDSSFLFKNIIEYYEYQ